MEGRPLALPGTRLVLKPRVEGILVVRVTMDRNDQDGGIPVENGGRSVTTMLVGQRKVVSPCIGVITRVPKESHKRMEHTQRFSKQQHCALVCHRSLQQEKAFIHQRVFSHNPRPKWQLWNGHIVAVVPEQRTRHG